MLQLTHLVGHCICYSWHSIALVAGCEAKKKDAMMAIKVLTRIQP